MNFTLRELLNSTWQLFISRLALAWAVVFAGIIPILLLGVLLLGFGFGGGLMGSLGSMAPPGGGYSGGISPALAGVLAGGALAMLVFLVVLVFVMPYCLGGLNGTAVDALGAGDGFSVWRFFNHGFKLYGRSLAFFLLALVLVVAMVIVDAIVGFVLHFILAWLVVPWVVAVYLAFACFSFYWLPAVYLGTGGQIKALRDAFRVTFPEGKWKQAIGFILVCVLAEVVLWLVATVLDITVIGLIIGVPLMIVGPIFLYTFFILGAFNAYSAGGSPAEVPAITTG